LSGKIVQAKKRSHKIVLRKKEKETRKMKKMKKIKNLGGEKEKK